MIFDQVLGNMISIYNIKSEYSEINPEDPSVMQLLEQLYC